MYDIYIFASDCEHAVYAISEPDTQSRYYCKVAADALVWYINTGRCTWGFMMAAGRTNLRKLIAAMAKAETACYDDLISAAKKYLARYCKYSEKEV